MDIDKFALTEIDFSKMPIDKFPNYSRSVIINGNLLVNGGYSEELKATLNKRIPFKTTKELKENYVKCRKNWEQNNKDYIVEKRKQYNK